MDEKLMELEEELIMKYPARLQRITIDKKQFYHNYNTGEIQFDIKTKSTDSKRSIVRFTAKMLDAKTYNLECVLGNKQSKKIKDLFKFIDYIIDNS